MTGVTLVAWVVAWAMLAGAVRAQDSAWLVPAETATYIQINGLSELRDRFEADPRLAGLFEPGQQPAQVEQSLGQIVEALGLTRREFFDRYFGRKLIIASPGEGHEGVIVSAVAPLDALNAVAKLQLQKIADSGPLAVYRGLDGHGRVAFGQGWMVVGAADVSFFDHVVRTIIHRQGDLAADEGFEAWARKLPSNVAAFLYHRAAPDAVHAAAFQYKASVLRLHYAGTFSQARSVLARITDAGASEFGPLPAHALAAAALNLYPDRVHPRLAERLDRLVAPRSFTADTLPGLGAPWLAGLVEVPGPQTGPDAASANIPALAMGLKLRNPAVARDVDAILQGLIDMVNIVAAAHGLEPLVVQTIDEDDEPYRVVDLGGLLARRLNRPEFAGLVRATFGRAGGWYLLCTQESLFRQCRRVAAGRAPALSFPTEDRPSPPPGRPLLTVVVHGPRAAHHLRALLPPLPAADASGAAPPQRLAHALLRIVESSPATTIQAWAMEDQTLRALATVKAD